MKNENKEDFSEEALVLFAQGDKVVHLKGCAGISQKVVDTLCMIVGEQLKDDPCDLPTETIMK